MLTAFLRASLSDPLLAILSDSVRLIRHIIGRVILVLVSSFAEETVSFASQALKQKKYDVSGADTTVVLQRTKACY